MEMETGTGTGTGTGTTRHEVLVVDDDPVIRNAIRFLLEDEGYAVHEAANGQQALDRLRSNPRRLVVLLDVQMPQVTGADVVEQVAEHIVLARHAYILITGHFGKTMSLDFVSLIRELDIPVVYKPFNLDKLLSAVEAADARLTARL
jgi:CheY-like chemotaxis protein